MPLWYRSFPLLEEARTGGVRGSAAPAAAEKDPRPGVWTLSGRPRPYHLPMARSEHRFVVHVWLEDGFGSPGGWRGAVDHLGHDRRLYFSSLGDLMDFIRARMSADSAEPSSLHRPT